MKTKKAIVIMTALGLLSLFLIPAAPAQAYTILVYGTEYCGFTQAMRHDLDNDKYRYTYYDVKKDDARSDEMWNKVKTVCPTCPLQGSVKLPVMDLNGQIFIRPSFEEVKQKIGAP